jgi:hypothetical protein
MKRSLVIALMIVTGLLLYSTSFVRGEKQGQANGTVTGLVSIKGEEHPKNGTVFFYDEGSGPPPSATRYWKVPTYVFKVDGTGRFNAVLPEGMYYMGVIVRQSEDPLGPPQEGDYFFISQDQKGRPKKLSIWKDSRIDLGAITGAVPFKRESLETKGITSLQGAIRDEKGTPVEGMLVFAYTHPSMFGRPLFVSERSDKSGKYLLRVSGGGTYYLLVRIDYSGGPRSTDELWGVRKGSKAVTVKTGTAAKDVDFAVSTVGVAATKP